MVILEGPDLSGKSTVGKMLAGITKLEIHHSGGPPKGTEEAIARVYDTPQNKILDRHICISEQIYGNMGRRNPKLTVSYMDLWLYKNQPLILFCDPGLEFLLSQLHLLKEKPHKTQEHIEQVRSTYKTIYHKYVHLMNKLKTLTRVMYIDFNSVTKEELKVMICAE